MLQFIDTKTPDNQSRSHSSISTAAEGYLKTVPELEEAAITPIRARVADHLGNSAPSTQQYVIRLEREGLVRLNGHPRAPVLTLTSEGMLRAMRRHRLLECCLHRMVGIGWLELHQEARRWERVMSTTVTERFDELLGYPRYSPFGNPIPTAWETRAAYLEECREVQCILDAAPFDRAPFRAELCWIGEPAQADPALLATLDGHGIMPGAKLSIEYDWDDARVISETLPGKPLTLDRMIAAQLFVRVM